MEIIKFNKDTYLDLKEECLLCIGFFDGMHLGHQQLFKKALTYPYKRYALTFNSSFKNDKLITPFKEKISLIKKYQIEKVFVIDLNEKLIKTSPIDFINLYLKKINPKLIICGEDFRFGFNNEGDADLLKQHFNVDVIKLLTLDDQKVSSTLIRQYLVNGDIKRANKYLGYNYFYYGIIKKGLGNGAKLGYKTANIDIDKNLVNLRNGVYICDIKINDSIYHGISNIGIHPSISKLDTPILEAHIFDIDDVEVGEQITIIFYDFIRDEIKFDDIEMLKSQINKDIDIAKSYFINKNDCN